MTQTVSGKGLLRSSDALFLDFDGTLAPIQDNAETVALASGMAAILEQVSEHLNGALAILSGRGLSDLSRRVPQSLWRFGNHGLYAAGPGVDATSIHPESPADLLSAIEQAAAPFDGVLVEPKGPVIAIHYRAAPQLGAPLGQALQQVVEATEAYKLQHGKCVYEAKPEAANKGICLSQALLAEPFSGRRPVMIGDDTTDEDAFRTAQEAGGFAIKVGTGDTRADYRVAGVDNVHEILKEMI
ncbi:MAG: trehalose-phosphatase [Henriciella sp.]